MGDARWAGSARTQPRTLVRMNLSLVFQVLFTVVFVLSAVLALYCVFTIHKNPHVSQTEKLMWLLLTLALPIFGPIAWISKMRMEKKYARGRLLIEGTALLIPPLIRIKDVITAFTFCVGGCAQRLLTEAGHTFSADSNKMTLART